MKKYYYVNKKGQQSGPVTADQLLLHGVTANTYVWCAGMDNWEKAGNIEELQHLFAENSDKTEVKHETLFDNKSQDTDTLDDCPDNNLTWAIVSAISFWPLAIIAIKKARQVKGLWKDGEKELAQKSARQARIWAIISIITGAALSLTSNVILLIACITIALMK